MELTELSKYVKEQKAVTIAFIVLCLAIVVAFENGVADPFDAFSAQVEFVIATIMELLTIASIPLALWMMKSRYVTRRFSAVTGEKERMLLCHRFSMIRLNILLVLMLINTLLYYMSALTVAYGYMAIILLISLGFVYPSKSRFAEECGINSDEAKS